MQIKKISISDPNYLNFAELYGNVYNSPSWISLHGSNISVYAVCENENILAIFNTFRFKKLNVNFFTPPPFSPDCSLALANEIDIIKVKPVLEDFLINVYKDYKVSFFRFCFPYSFTQALKSIKIIHKLNHTYVLDISQTHEIMSLYTPKRRQQIRRAIKDGLRVEQIRDKEILFNLVVKTFERQQKKIDKKLVRRILFEFANPTNSFSFMSSREGKPITAYLCIYHKAYAFYVLGGYDEKEKHIGAGPLAMNACIEFAKKNGINYFDFEGSMEPSIGNYFKEFGGEKKHYLCYERKNFIASLLVKAKQLLGK